MNTTCMNKLTTDIETGRNDCAQNVFMFIIRLTKARESYEYSQETHVMEEDQRETEMMGTERRATPELGEWRRIE